MIAEWMRWWTISFRTAGSTPVASVPPTKVTLAAFGMGIVESRSEVTDVLAHAALASTPPVSNRLGSRRARTFGIWTSWLVMCGGWPLFNNLYDLAPSVLA